MSILTHSVCILSPPPLSLSLRAETQAWDLQSLLIKPVQRVLKYPLLLDKLVQATSDKHVDYKHIHMARETVAHVAQDINEIKRRKDLGGCGLVINGRGY